LAGVNVSEAMGAKKGFGTVPAPDGMEMWSVLESMGSAVAASGSASVGGVASDGAIKSGPRAEVYISDGTLRIGE
jgi:hypothetical protein